MDKINILGISFDNVTIDEAVLNALNLSESKNSKYIVTPNAEIVLFALKDNDYLNCLNNAALILPDGISIIKAAKILKTPLKQKVAGIEFAEKLLENLNENKKKLFLLGGKPGIAEEAVENLSKKYPGINICGTNDGYFTDENEVINKINKSEPDILFVCLGAPKQELFMYNNAKKLKVGVMAGLGGSIDIFANKAKRAPRIFVRLGLEWFYRLLKQPSRIKRQYKLFGFFTEVNNEKKRRLKIEKGPRKEKAK